MPIYEYVCPECGEKKEIRISFSESDINKTLCSNCGTEMKRVISPVAHRMMI